MNNRSCKFDDGMIHYSHFIAEHAEQSHFFKHAHNEYELLYFIRGDANYIIEDTSYTLSPCDLIFIKPKNYHVLALKASETLYERVDIAFTPALFDKNILEMLFAENRKITMKDNPFFIDWTNRIETYIVDYGEKDKRQAVYALMTELILFLKNSLFEETARDSATTNLMLGKVIEYINANIAGIKGVNDVSQTMFISESYLLHLFKKHLNVTPKAYINEKKMLKAEEYLKNGMRPNDVYTALAFDDYSSFFRAFKKYFGRSPSAIAQNKAIF